MRRARPGVSALALVAALGCRRVGGPAQPGVSEPSVLGAATAGPLGYHWRRVQRWGFGSVEVPSSPGWTAETTAMLEVSNEALGVTVVIQQQQDIAPEQRAEYVASFVGVNQRDAPGYVVTEQRFGAVGRHGAARVDGAFNNGVAMTTRDYVVFAEGYAIALMARAPATRLEELRAVADHVASSLRIP